MTGERIAIQPSRAPFADRVRALCLPRFVSGCLNLLHVYCDFDDYD